VTAGAHDAAEPRPPEINPGAEEQETTMAVLERIATLVRANLNDLIDRAEDPEKMIKQVILDMENQLLQVKTQVAISMADLHLLQKKQKAQEDKAAEWMRKAELAVGKGQDDLARSALERYQSFIKLAEGYTRQVADQRLQVDTLRNALDKLDQKLGEAHAKSDLMLAQHRRARALSKASDAQLAAGDRSNIASFDRMRQKVMRSEAVSQAKAEFVADDVDRRFDVLEKEDDIDRLLSELKARRTPPA
jgi:phage shock protein A